MDTKFTLGIDLGTSNSAAALTDLSNDQCHIVELSQIVAPNQISEKLGLPSALYIPNASEFPAEAIQLPWQQQNASHIIGEFAHNHGALIPDRLITSAKSWLSNDHIDARQPVLPWNSEIDEPKLSAYDCTAAYLQHIKESFLHSEACLDRHWNLADGQVVLTVPASFDEVARNLTAEAAEAAGLHNVTLLEEPQAAFYAWTAQSGNDWRKQVSAGDIILVCDIGGGTADFSLIAVSEHEGNLAVERISVGEHLLLGGDNMDLALAYTMRAQLDAEGTDLDDWQFLSLIHAARQAKVRLFADSSVDEVPISIPSRGSSLFAGTISTSLNRATLEAVVVEGFFPITSADDLPAEGNAAALQEFGLPYASDPVISKHIARFLTRSLQNVLASEDLRQLVGSDDALAGSFLKPNAILFNGGVFKAEPVRRRVLELLSSWSGGSEVRELQGYEPDLAVARGASYYGRNRTTGEGLRIKSGTARSYYIGLESSMPAVPGFKPPVKALCVVPQGMEEGTEVLIDQKEFGLLTGKPSHFRFFSSEIRSGDQAGEILPNAERELDETSRLEATLTAAEGFPEGQPIPVVINAVVTELGQLELWLKHSKSDQRWKVELQVRMD
ncbi:Hsp70 family protein [Persicirhabdus sediminis]|uniref:Hsp70 family protein n=1 Tax=Persicirhabdus sediminis TaxID=454144 RepID=A0A8J7MIY5_9BACT|nr:Hsp70 family protein [Persicirhabdus sediminis]MBK1792859.1 Hsp70 family protein [Persicirhabdus sediminis]